MPLLRRKGLFESNKVVFLPIAAISPNPGQPRRHFSRAGLEELAASIGEHGVLQPLSVRRVPGGYELISGERRLRASRMAGLEEVPCILVSVDGQESSLLALVENLQRRDLDFVEEAAALSRLIRTFGLSQEEAAKKLGKSQSAIANKLRLLKLPPEVLALLREKGFTERHARALLRLETAEQQAAAARAVVEGGLTVARQRSMWSAPPPRAAGPAEAHHRAQGCAALPQHGEPGPVPDEAGRCKGKLPAPGNRRRHPAHHYHPQVGAHLCARPPVWYASPVGPVFHVNHGPAFFRIL